MNKQEYVPFQIALGAVKHFGKNLYTTNPPAIAELIANAWDAYAKKCQIIVNDDNSMYIIDDGIGMTDEELWERYAKSGFDKNNDIRVPANMMKRKYMGKKGIGKFSAFSLSEEYVIYTKSVMDEKWKKLTLKYSELYSDNTIFNAELFRLDDPADDLIMTTIPYDIPKDSGTIIVLPKLIRKVNKATKNSLMQLIAKRFSTTLFEKNNEFNLELNFEEITPIVLREHFFYSKVEFVYFFGMTLKDLKKRFPNVSEENFVDKNNDYFETHAKGWIGTVNKPTDLRADDQTSVSGVAIYINGKIADENIFKQNADHRIPNSYLIGEVDLFNWDNDGDNDDPVLSSREGLNHELLGIIKLKDELTKIRNDLIEQWNSMRASRPLSKQDYINNILLRPENKNIYDKLGEETQKRVKNYAQRLFDNPKDDGTSDQEKIIDLLFSAIVQISTDEEMQTLKDENCNDNDNLNLLEKIIKIFELNEISHALRLRDSLKGKLEAINLLEEYQANEEVESAFEKVLANNPWLINPIWEVYKSMHKQKWLELVKENNEDEERVRTDIIIEIQGENLPIIVELKRDKFTSYSAPDANEVVNQIHNYRTAIAQYLNKNTDRNKMVTARQIEAYFICGDKAMDKLKNDVNSFDFIKQNNIKLKTYDNMIMTAKQLLRVYYNQSLNDDA